jgi:hypothetical protein
MDKDTNYRWLARRRGALDQLGHPEPLVSYSGIHIPMEHYFSKIMPSRRVISAQFLYLGLPIYKLDVGG